MSANQNGSTVDGSAVQEWRAAVDDAARPEAVAYQHDRGKLTARERIRALVDDGSFAEFGELAVPDRLGEDGRPVFADAMIVGRAEIAGRPAVVASADFTVSGGSNGLIGLEKLARGIEIARSEGCPVVFLLEGGGHRIQEGLDSRAFAPGVEIPRLQALLSGWVPTVAAILGPAFAGPTLIAAMCDYVVTVRGLSLMGIAPPKLVELAVGERIDAEALAGAAVQAERNGVADLAVDSEAEAFAAIRGFLSYLPGNADERPPPAPPLGPAADSAAALPTAVPANMRQAYDVVEVIRGIVDDGSVQQVKPGYARNVVTALARINGRPVGVIANQPREMAGTIDGPACDKLAHFIRLCDVFGLALISLIDVPGFLVGSTAETSKLARKSARVLYELGRVTVPLHTIILRKAYGAAYVAMGGGRGFQPAVSAAWPTAEFAALPVEMAVDVALHRTFAQAEDPAAARAHQIAEFRQGLGPKGAAEGFGIDTVIEPHETRALLARALRHAPVRDAEHRGPRRRGVPPI
jgi:propionyl-CoA carboxylase beta chain